MRTFRDAARNGAFALVLLSSAATTALGQPAPEKNAGASGRMSPADLIPSVGHFRRGQWRKGASDLWNTVSVLWFILEPSTSIRRMKKDLGNYAPGTRDHANNERNIKIYQELQYILLATAVLNYVNSVLDCMGSDDDESFFSAFAAIDTFRYDTHMTMTNGYRAVGVTKTGGYGGFNFGYRRLFEVYARMFLPLPGMRMQRADLYTDYIIPYHPHGAVDLYAGLGFNAGGYQGRDVMYGGGLGMHPRIGVSYQPDKKSYYRLNLIPYMFWNEVITKDPSRSDMPSTYYDLRFARQSFGDNYGFQVIHRYKYAKRWFVQTSLDYSRVVEPAGDYVETKPDSTQLFIHRDKEASRMLRLDLSLNYAF